MDLNPCFIHTVLLELTLLAGRFDFVCLIFFLRVQIITDKILN